LGIGRIFKTEGINIREKIKHRKTPKAKKVPKVKNTGKGEVAREIKPAIVVNPAMRTGVPIS
jgi:type III secretion system FlhB-like substrate exporter